MCDLKNLLYAKTHEWVKVNGDVCLVGVTDYAQKNLGSVVFLEAYEGEYVNKGNTCGVIESIKAASDLLAPVTGEIIEVNHECIDNPELINQNPYLNWILKIRFDNQNDFKELLSEEEYTKITK